MARPLTHAHTHTEIFSFGANLSGQRIRAIDSPHPLSHASTHTYTKIVLFGASLSGQLVWVRDTHILTYIHTHRNLLIWREFLPFGASSSGQLVWVRNTHILTYIHTHRNLLVWNEFIWTIGRGTPHPLSHASMHTYTEILPFGASSSRQLDRGRGHSYPHIYTHTQKSTHLARILAIWRKFIRATRLGEETLISSHIHTHTEIYSCGTNSFGQLGREFIWATKSGEGHSCPHVYTHTQTSTHVERIHLDNSYVRIHTIRTHVYTHAQTSTHVERIHLDNSYVRIHTIRTYVYTHAQTSTHVERIHLDNWVERQTCYSMPRPVVLICMCNTLQHTAVHCSTLQHTAPHCTTLHYTALNCNTLHHTATRCNTLQHTATRCSTLQHTSTHCNTLQNTATHCNTLQHTATHCSTLQHTL